MEKQHLDRRLEQMQAEGTRFRTGVDVGGDTHGRGAAREVRRGRARARRDRRRATCRCPAASSAASCRRWSTCRTPTGAALDPAYDVPINAAGKHVVIIGGGDTGADCLGTAHRQGAASVTQLEILPRPADERPATQPVADLAADLPDLQRARGGRRAGVRRQHQAASSATTTGRCGRSSWSRSTWSTAGSSRSRAPSARSRPSWCCSRWASPVRSRPGVRRAARRRARPARQRRAGRRLHDHGARRLRRR